MGHKRLWLIALTMTALIVGLVASVGVTSANDTLTDTEVGPQTIDLLGLTWDKSVVTWRLQTGGNITPEAERAMRDAIERWTHHLEDFSFTLREFDATIDDDPDIIFKFKRGGGLIAGQARWKQQDGFFQQVTISVSGSAFGDPSGAPLVESITMQELGHGLGLGHSDNPKDVMFGTVQDPPNTLLSDCDIAAWGVVMAWLGSTTPAPPTDPSVSCGGATNGGGPLGGTLSVSVTIVDEPAGGYNPGDRVHIDVLVTHPVVGNVAGAAVQVTVNKPDGTTAQGNSTTGSGGVAHFSYRTHKKFQPLGPHTVDASATKDLASGICTTTCADFVVN